MLKRIAKLLKILNSEAAPHQISAGFCLAMIMGLTPLWSLHNLLVFFLVLVLRVNLSAFILGWVLFSGIAYLLDPLFHVIGYACLTADGTNSLWVFLNNLNLFRLARFNNSVVMGSLLFSITLFIPMFLTINFLIRKYREHILAWVQKTKIAAMIKSSRLFSTYQSLSERNSA